eukprot:gene4427-4680_t
MWMTGGYAESLHTEPGAGPRASEPSTAARVESSGARQVLGRGFSPFEEKIGFGYAVPCASFAILDVSIEFCDNAYMGELNRSALSAMTCNTPCLNDVRQCHRATRGREGTTEILSFNYGKVSRGSPEVGAVYISTQLLLERCLHALGLVPTYLERSSGPVPLPKPGPANVIPASQVDPAAWDAFLSSLADPCPAGLTMPELRRVVAGLSGPALAQAHCTVQYRLLYHVAHGVCHVAGHDHENPEDAAKMEATETFLMRQWFENPDCDHVVPPQLLVAIRKPNTGNKRIPSSKPGTGTHSSPE